MKRTTLKERKKSRDTTNYLTKIDGWREFYKVEHELLVIYRDFWVSIKNMDLSDKNLNIKPNIDELLIDVQDKYLEHYRSRLTGERLLLLRTVIPNYGKDYLNK